MTPSTYLRAAARHAAHAPIPLPPLRERDVFERIYLALLTVRALAPAHVHEAAVDALQRAWPELWPLGPVAALCEAAAREDGGKG